MASSKKPRRGELPERLATFLKQAVCPGQSLLLGLSGGLDSRVLLDLLVGARDSADFQLRSLHVNHGISPDAAEWEHFCEQLCVTYQVPFTSVRVTVPRDSGLGIEAAARQARYQVLLAQPADAVVLAHHQDDQAETLLLQLLRGAGVKGMAGMGKISPQSSVLSPRLLRPLLDVPRSTLEAYAKEHGLRWIEDESNLDLAYDRNFLRRHIFPELEKRFPASRTTLARSASHLAEAAALLDEMAGEDAARLVRQGRLALAGLRTLSPARGRNLLRFWLSGHLAPAPNTRRLQEIYRQLLDARPDAQLRIAVEGGQVRRYREEAWFEPHGAAATFPEVRWRGEPELALPLGRLIFSHSSGAGLALAKVRSGELWIRARRGGERFRPDCRRPTRSLRHLFQEAGLPPWERQTLPLIYLGGDLAAVPGIGVACDLQAGPGEDGMVITWQRH